ncbi:MAG: nucleotidyl transferase AbiEii/AbiGii toxin family protein [Armatimonadota bacterium]
MADIPLVTLQRLVAALDSVPALYAIIGGVAVSIQSVPRFTEDVDAVIWFGEDNWDVLLEKLTASGFTSRSGDPIDFARKNRIFLLTDHDGVHVDLSIGALPFEETVVRNADRIEIAPGTFASIATVESLIVMKAVAWRPKDILDIREIVSINPEFDRKYVVDTFSEYAELLEVPERVGQLEAIFDEKS